MTSIEDVAHHMDSRNVPGKLPSRENATMSRQLAHEAASEGIGAWLQAIGACLIYTATW